MRTSKDYTECPTYTNTLCIVYTGIPLPYLGINPGDDVTGILEDINTILPSYCCETTTTSTTIVETTTTSTTINESTTTTSTTEVPTTTTTTTYCETCFGLLYNWYAATDNIDGRSIAPIGWHVGTWQDFEALSLAIEPLSAPDGDTNTVGGKLKIDSNCYWNDPNVGILNIYNFNAVGTGQRMSDIPYYAGAFLSLKDTCSFWNSNTLDWDPNNPLITHLQNNLEFIHTSVAVHGFNGFKTEGRPIRCFKDNEDDIGTVTDIDGNIYPTIKIGNIVVMAENLKVTHYNDGSPIPEIQDNTDWINLTSGALCAYNNNWNYACVSTTTTTTILN